MIFPLKMVIFHCYVSSPEGKHWKNMDKHGKVIWDGLQISVFQSWFSFVSHHILRSYLSRSQEVPVQREVHRTVGPERYQLRGGTWRFPCVFQPVNQRITIFRIVHVFGMRFPNHSGSAICRKKQGLWAAQLEVFLPQAACSDFNMEHGQIWHI